MLFADRSRNEHTNFTRINTGSFDGRLPRHCSSIGKGNIGIPPTTFFDSG